MRWPQLKIKNRKTAIFLVCLGISAFFWLLIKLSKEYEITVNLAVDYKNFPQNKLLINNPDSILVLKITDNGFDLIPYSLFGSLTKLDIDVQSLNFRKYPGEKSIYFVKTEFLSERINSKLSSKNYISVIRPDSLVIRMVDLKEKKVKVVPDIEYSLSPQFQLREVIKCQPDSVVLFGSQSALSKIHQVTTQKLEFYNLNKSLLEYTDLILPEETNSNTKEVAIEINVEKFTESNIQIPLKKHLKLEEDFKIFPANLNIKYAVSFEKFSFVNKNDFSIELEKDSTSEGKINIHLESYPNYIRVIDYHPKAAEYIIIK